ncbi:MAG: DNA recombination protein RmuC [Ignavibacteriaceae bacterium]
MEIIFLIIGLIIGALAAFFVAKFKYEGTSGKVGERNSFLEEELNKNKEELRVEREKVIRLNSENSALNSDYKNLQEKLSEQKSEVEELQAKFTKEFENLANKILTEKSETFTKQNRDNLDQILKPLGERIKDFEKKVEDVYVTDSKERASLVQQIKTLHELNQQMSKDATNLTNALKGETKTQGNWGEFILESLLEKSGLAKDREYFLQESITSQEGRRFQPDVIVKLPDNKSIVIDSKVSLIAYEKFSSSENENDRLNGIREHLLSIRNHIKNLSSKNYQNLYSLESLDFVLMFLPIEPAFSLALQNDSGLFQEAYDKNIVIVSPTTLLATLRTIASIWRQENQNKNAIEIARQSGALYDKFVGFVEDLQTIGSRIEQTQSSYNDAMKKLSEGSGNLIKRAEKIKQLGAKASKTLPQSLIDDDENLLEE